MKNQLKKTEQFRVGGWARSKAWGTRVYRVVGMSQEFMEVVDNPWWKDPIVHKRMVTYVTLQKVFETNKGNPVFCNSRPFTVNDLPYSHDKRTGTLSWYYPAEATGAMPFYVRKKHFVVTKDMLPSIPECIAMLRAH